MLVDGGEFDEARTWAEPLAAGLAKTTADHKASDGDRDEAAMRIAIVQARLGGVTDVRKTLGSVSKAANMPVSKFELDSAYAAAGCYDEAAALAKVGDPLFFPLGYRRSFSRRRSAPSRVSRIFRAGPVNGYKMHHR